jgi:methionyl-tRNA formyltransferase
MKIVFLGTAKFGNIILEELCKTNYKPVSCQYEDIKKIKPDLVIVANYGKIIPQDILNIPRYGFLNVHPSLLPKYRGPSPIQFSILNGDKETGITIILMDAKVDHGPILAQRKTIIGENETAAELRDRLAVLGAKLLIDVIPDWLRGKIKLRRQDERKATYTKILVREDGKIDWKKSVKVIERQIRAFCPWPGTYTFYKGKRLKILKARLEKNKLIIEEVQLEGKKPTSFEDFLRGYPSATAKFKTKN